MEPAQGFGINLPTDFGKIGYSLLIAPAFAFSNLRVRTMAIGFISALVMSLGLFPVNALAKKLLKEERFRRWSLLFYALSATMTYSMTYASEVLFIPVMVLLIYLIYQLLTDAWHGKKKILMLVVTVAGLAAGISGQGTGTCDTGGIGLIFCDRPPAGLETTERDGKGRRGTGQKADLEISSGTAFDGGRLYRDLPVFQCGNTVLSTGI